MGHFLEPLLHDLAERFRFLDEELRGMTDRPPRRPSRVGIEFTSSLSSSPRRQLPTHRSATPFSQGQPTAVRTAVKLRCRTLRRDRRKKLGCGFVRTPATGENPVYRIILHEIQPTLLAL